MIEPITRDVEQVLEEHEDHRHGETPKAMQIAATQTLFVHTWAAKCEAADSR